LTDGTASLLRYDDRRRQLDLLCVIGVLLYILFSFVVFLCFTVHNIVKHPCRTAL